MPSYADMMSSRLAAPRIGGPVRIIVSGKWTWDERQGAWGYEETDEREEAMEVDELLVEGSDQALEAQGEDQEGSAEKRSGRGARAAGKGAGTTLGARAFGSRTERGCRSIVVLDTNVLISSLAFFDALFDLLLQFRLSTLSTRAQAGPSRPSPMILVVPYVVLVELDGLKKGASSAAQGRITNGRPPKGPSSQQRELGEKAQEATRWILAALQRQKRSYLRLQPLEEEEMTEVDLAEEKPLDERDWVLHVERREEARARKGDVWDMTPDEEILSLCSSLSTASASDGVDSSSLKPLDAFLVSNDLNARARAEAEGVRTLDLNDVLGVKRGVRDSALAHEASVARELLEQWDVQLGTEALHQEAVLAQHHDRPVEVVALAPPSADSVPSEPAEEEPMSLDDEYPNGEKSMAHTAILSSPPVYPQQALPSHPSTGPASGSGASVWATASPSPTRRRGKPDREMTPTGFASTAGLSKEPEDAAGSTLNPTLDLDVSDLPAAYPTRFAKRKAEARGGPGVGSIVQGETAGRGSGSSMWSRSAGGASKKRW